LGLVGVGIISVLVTRKIFLDSTATSITVANVSQAPYDNMVFIKGWLTFTHKTCEAIGCHMVAGWQPVHAYICFGT